MPISRRKMLTRGAAVAAGSIPFIPQVAAGQAPTQLTGTNVGRRFKAFVRRGTGATVEELRLRAIKPREVLVRSQASAVCYTIVGGALARYTIPMPPFPMEAIISYGPSFSPGVRFIV